MTSIFQLEIDGDGVAIVTLDAPGRSMNVIGEAFLTELEGVVGRIVDDPGLTGAVITSGKPAFLAGADLVSVEGQLRAAGAGQGPPAAEFSRVINGIQRRLETCGKPVAAAINGTALGGGLELCLACHYRVVADSDVIRLGLPEVTVGLLPGGGGTQRLPRLIGIERALPLLVKGAALSPREALAEGIVDAVVPLSELISTAKAWVRANPKATQPWDRRGFQPPGGTPATNPRLANLIMQAMGTIQRQGNRNYPAPLAILSCVYEGSILPIDRALKIESGYFGQLFKSPVAANVIRTNFISKGALDKLVHRPKGVERRRVSKLGVLGAGMMGAGIAYAAAAVGVQVVLLDRSLEAAKKGKAYSATVLAREGRSDRAAGLLELITPTTDYVDLADCDFIIEAVFEDRAIKADVTRATVAVVRPGTLFGSNTSTLPITGLAEAHPTPERFIGIHFFSPVDRMQLVEIIRGEQTSDETLAETMDFVRQIRKTPILVNDHRGFYTSRVFGTYLDEGMKMVLEGISPALIENAGRASGMPVGPLTLQDEVSFELSYVVRNQTRDDLGKDYKPKMAEPIIDLFYETLGRLGKKNGAGFYDYPPGQPKRLWPGLADHFPVAEEQPSLEELKTRFLYIQAVETARCLEEGVLESPMDGDVGAVLGWSFAAHTGGPLSMIDTIGLEAFVRECRRLEQRYGGRFRPPTLLVDMAEANRRFYEAA